MKTFAYFLPILVFSASAAMADERTTVTFVDSERYADAGHGAYETDTNLRELERHFVGVGSRYLRPGQTLAIEILDVDLAGRWDPRVSGTNPRLRVITDGAHVPLVRLRFRLRVDGTLAADGEERITDLGFSRRINPYPTDEPLRYEKKMLDDWFAARILPKLGDPR